MRRGPSRLARIVAAAGVVFLTLLMFKAVPSGFAERDADAWVYLAAGERLNAGHDLYQLADTDRPVKVVPPLWPSPLLSPPPIAVAWRPLAVLGELAMGLWCAGGILASGGLIAWGLRFGGAWSLLSVVLFGPFLLYAAVPGNANAYLAPLLALAWLQRRRPWLPALAVVATAAVKVTPIALAPWLIERRRLAWAAIDGVVVLASTLVFAPGGLATWVGSSGSPTASPLSLAGILQTDPRATTLVIIVATWIAALAIRRRERAVFAIGLIGATFAMPAFYLHSMALLAPLIVVDRAPAAVRTGAAKPASDPAAI